MIHAVKCLPKYFEPLENGSKTFEARKNDRPYRVGDYLAVNEFIPESTDPYEDFLQPPSPSDERFADGGRYSGRCLLFQITYILSDNEYCQKGIVILGLRYVLGGECNA